MSEEKIFYKIEDRTDLIKDAETGAILNTSLSALDTYKKQRGHMNKINNVQNEIDKLKNDIGEIKDLLRELLRKE